MARVKVTSSDINAKLAKGECANYRANGCQGRTPCAVVNGEACQYFNTYVKPLLDYNDQYMAKYGREAKISVALNPKSKVVRKRRQASEPALTNISVPAAPVSSLRAKSDPAELAKVEPAAVPNTLPAPTAAAASPKRLTAAHAAKEALVLSVDLPVTKGKKTPPIAAGITPLLVEPVTISPKEKKKSQPPTEPVLREPVSASSVNPPACRQAQSPAAMPAGAGKETEVVKAPAAATVTISSTGKKPAEPAPAEQRGKSAAQSAPESAVTAPPTATRRNGKAKSSSEEEQPQLFGDLFATPAAPRNSRKR